MQVATPDEGAHTGEDEACVFASAECAAVNALSVLVRSRSAVAQLVTCHAAALRCLCTRVEGAMGPFAPSSRGAKYTVHHVLWMCRIVQDVAAELEGAQVRSGL